MFLCWDAASGKTSLRYISAQLRKPPQEMLQGKVSVFPFIIQLFAHRCALFARLIKC